MSAAKRSLLVVLSGPSGVGKDSLLDGLEARGHRFHRVVTCTTRPMREGERDGVDYFFVSDATFDGMLAEGGLLEHAVVYGHRYGVPRAQVVEALAAGSDVYVRTDVQGAASIRAVMPAAVLVFIAPASLDDLEARIRARRLDSEASTRRRLATAAVEMARIGEFEHVVVNAEGRLGEAVDTLERILEAERRLLRDSSNTP